MRLKTFIISPLLFLMLICLALNFTAHALAAEEDFAGLATSIPLQNKNPKIGAIVSANGNGYNLSSKTYDSNTYGVVTQTPGVVIENIPMTNLTYVVYSGQTRVLVSTS